MVKNAEAKLLITEKDLRCLVNEYAGAVVIFAEWRHGLRYSERYKNELKCADWIFRDSRNNGSTSYKASRLTIFAELS